MILRVSTSHPRRVTVLFTTKFGRLCLAVTATTLAMAAPTLAEPKFSFANTPGQLPKTVVPESYSITLAPDPKTLQFVGSETIDIDVRKPTRTIILNALNLEIPEAKLADLGLAATIKIDNEKQTATFTFPQEIAQGKHKLALSFKGKAGSQAEGIYYVRYQTDRGEKVLFGTQMEATDARRMFPNWDEPVFRARFALTVKVPSNFMAVSNMPIVEEKSLGTNLKQVRFQETPSMASYLVVLVAGELAAIEDEVDGVKMRVVTTAGKQETGRYALNSLKKILPFYNDYFGQKFPLPKLDMIAIPGGFGGAMENWGGITYNETALLFDPANSSQQTKERVFIVVAHEVAHQWFGDLVTMAWWDNLWLNEGFASWMEAKATAQFNPTWNTWLRYDAPKQEAMDSDARSTTHPIQQPVRDPAEAAGAFDEITYQKGGAVIRMFETYLGEEKFRAGIRSYMAAHQYGSTTTADLWASLQQASGADVGAIAASWTEQPGFPVVVVDGTCSAGKRRVKLSQERFTIDDPKADPLGWQIPITYTTAVDATPQTYLLKDKSAMIDGGNCDTPLKLNAGNTGYYRVQYSTALQQQLKDQFALFPLTDRLNLLSDSWALVKANRSSTKDYLNLAQGVRDETDLALWSQVLGTLSAIDNIQIDQPGRPAFQSYGRDFLANLYKRLGWDAKPDEPETTALLRSKMLTLLGDFRDKGVITEARLRFAAYLKEPKALAPNLRPTVFHIVGRYSDQATYDQLHRLAIKTQSTEEKKLFYGSMTDALDPVLAKQTLQIVFKNELEPGLASDLVTQVADNGEQPGLAWEFAKTHTKALLDMQASFRRNRYIPRIARNFAEQSRADELEAFAKANLPADAMSEVKKALTRIRYRADLKKRELPIIDTYACNQKAGSSPSNVRFCVDVR
ncbi:MAG: M1 family metallopeptidase [Anaerolineae bacterium]|nr:M1 family metallopeptidase [Gloeobacterales cyanobacterium ES-bin-313]